MAAAAVVALGIAATLVTLSPGARLTSSATPAPTRTPVIRAASAQTSGSNQPTVISITASSGQDRQIRAVEAWLASHAGSLSRPVSLVVTVPPPPPPPPPPAPPPAAPVQQAAPPAPTPSGSAQQIAMAMLASYGWSSDQFACLDPLWQRESGWNVYAANPDGAYGIPQAMPGSKMASAGPDWQSDAATQISWGLSYIQATYGSPCAAWSHEQATGWY
jgi:hypothetical protein